MMEDASVTSNLDGRKILLLDINFDIERQLFDNPHKIFDITEIGFAIIYMSSSNSISQWYLRSKFLYSRFVNWLSYKGSILRN